MKQGYGVCHQAHNTSDFQTLISLFFTGIDQENSVTQFLTIW